MEVPCHVLEEGHTVSRVVVDRRPSRGTGAISIEGSSARSPHHVDIEAMDCSSQLALRGCHDAAVEEVAERATVFLLVDGRLEHYASSAGF